MSYSIEVRPDDLVIVAVMNADFNVQRELAGYAEELAGKLDQLPRPWALITDVDAVVADLGDAVTGLGLLTRGRLAVLSHPNLSEIIVVTTRDLFTLSAKALGQAQYGMRQVVVTRTMAEALEHVRQQNIAS